MRMAMEGWVAVYEDCGYGRQVYNALRSDHYGWIVSRKNGAPVTTEERKAIIAIVEAR